MKWNHKRIERVYVKLGMNKRRRKMKRRVPNPEKSPLLQPLAPNITWSADFMHNRLENGRKVRVLNIIDDYDRQALMCEVGFGFRSEEHTSELQSLMRISYAVFCLKKKIILYIQLTVKMT